MLQDEELDKILVKFFNKAEEDVHSGNFTREGLLITKAHTQAKQAIKALYRTREATLIREAEERLIENLMGYGERGGDLIYKQTIGAEVFHRWITNQQKGEQ